MSRTLQPATACLDFLETAYDWETPDEPWLTTLVEAAGLLWQPTWALGVFYDASDVHRFGYTNLVTIGASEAIQDFIPTMMGALPPEFIAATYRSLSAGFGRSITGGAEPGWETLASAEVSDIFGINGLDPSGLGCFIGLAVRRSAMTAAGLALAHRLAAHLAAGYRCRRRLRATDRAVVVETAEAVLDRSGKLLEARGPAQQADARQALQEAGLRIADLRDQRGADDPSGQWHPQVQARWTIVDAPSTKGEQYLVARENVARAEGLLSLTDREQQVVFEAALGKSTKQIAYDLGISDSTVRVLLARVYSRLKVQSRAELLALPSIKALRGEDA